MVRCRFAVAVPNLGPFADPAAIISLAQLAEDADWDGFFLWDHLLWTWPEPTDVIEPWPVLARARPRPTTGRKPAFPSAATQRQTTLKTSGIRSPHPRQS